MKTIRKDVAWFFVWLTGIGLLCVWLFLFLNAPSRALVIAGFANTIFICSLVIVFSLFLGWGTALILHYLNTHGKRPFYLIFTFILNLIRSIPQIIGILFGYVFITTLIVNGHLLNTFYISIFMAFYMSIFIFNEIADLITERIGYYRRLDFFDAMRVCGISEWKIINSDIILKNSHLHIVNKLISVFGVAVFLQCSVDFIVSIGLSSQVSLVNLPATLGNLLAKIDSKQDILAVGYTLTHPTYVFNLFFKHLQGLSTAFLLVFTLFCMFNIANRYAERHHL
jgi:ABC-type methionine transport system permease subunit